MKKRTAITMLIRKNRSIEEEILEIRRKTRNLRMLSLTLACIAIVISIISIVLS